MLVGCDASSEQWELRCYGNAWMTESGDSAANINCTQGTPPGYILLELRFGEFLGYGVLALRLNKGYKGYRTGRQYQSSSLQLTCS